MATLLALAAPSAHAQSAAPLAVPAPATDPAAANCDVPAYLIATEAPLAQAASAVTTRKQLEILVVGTASSALATEKGVAISYPARLEAVLRERLSIPVNVTTALQSKKTTADMQSGLGKLVAERKPDLVVWQTGTVDAMRFVDPDEFRTALDEGVTVLQDAGTDVLLMNLQYNPRMETMLSVAPYIDTMRVVAQEREIPLFDRFSVMRHWSENGGIDLFNSSQGFGVAKQVHECIARALAAQIIETAKINPAEIRIQN